jgi:predicted lipid-binding transport protein (Tim44 family)
MYGFIVLDYLLVAIAIVVSLRLFHTAHRPQEGVEVRQPGLLLAPVARETVRPPRANSGEVTTPLSETLKRISAASGYAGIESFLDGAKVKYEAIIRGFASGDLEPVTSLLSHGVYDDFARAIAERDDRGETVGLMFIGFRAAEIVDAGIANGSAWIEVRFVGELVSVTRDRDDRIVAGHPAMVVDVPELWTFERELRSSQPHWLLTATEPDE